MGTEPMDMAVSLWKLIHNKDYFDQHQRLMAVVDQSHERQASALLEACENLDTLAIYDVVDQMQPSAFVIAQLVVMAKKSQRKSTAVNAASAMLKNDPKQKEKASVRECWEIWQTKPQNYDGKTAFARDMLEKYPSLTSIEVITRWCRHWEKATKQAE